MNETRYIKIEFPTNYKKGGKVTLQGIDSKDIDIDVNGILTADEVLKECNKYTAEEYRLVLKAVSEMTSNEQEKVFGEILNTMGYIRQIPASELIEKYYAYKNSPQIGEYWKTNPGDRMCIVYKVRNKTVFFYYCDGDGDSCSIAYFVKNFKKTKRKSKYFDLLLKEMKEVNE